MEAFVVLFEDLNAGDVARAGGKGANLGELARAGFPVPPGFVVTAQAHLHAMHESGVRLDRVVDCWASMAGERALTYRACQGITDEPAIAVVVQAMIDSERSGVMFSVDPATGDRSR